MLSRRWLARSLVNYYLMVGLNDAGGEKWSLIGAENGDPDMQYSAYALLKIHKSDLDRARGLYWLTKAASAGY